MKRIEKKLKELSQDNQKAFVGYIVAGDPDLETSLELMHLSVDSGVDILEIGVPFTDPIAEGPTIQQAHHRSLENETNLQKNIDLIYYNYKIQRGDIAYYKHIYVSTIDILNPLSRSIKQVWLPMKPSPPVAKIVDN